MVNGFYFICGWTFKGLQVAADLKGGDKEKYFISTDNFNISNCFDRRRETKKKNEKYYHYLLLNNCSSAQF